MDLFRSHIFFPTNDIILVAEAEMEQVKILNDTINMFCDVLGQ